MGVIMIRIEVKAPIMDVEIEKKIFKLDLSDNAYSRFYSVWNKSCEVFAKYQNNSLNNSLNNSENFEELEMFKESCKRGINAVLLEEPFEEIYALCGQSTVRVMQILEILVKAINNREV